MLWSLSIGEPSGNFVKNSLRPGFNLLAGLVLDRVGDIYGI